MSKLLIVPKSTNEYNTAYTKDIEKWNFMYQAQSTGYLYRPELPNRPMGNVTNPVLGPVLVENED